MTSNLQVNYLFQLEAALELALHGNIQQCHNILFELRLRSDLSFYTRALVNLSLFNLTKAKDHPHRTEYAREALRLAVELKNERNPNVDLFWERKYDELVDNATKAVERADQDDIAAEREWQAERAATMEGDVSKLQLEEEEGGLEKVLVGAGDLVKEEWDIEGTLTLNLDKSVDSPTTMSISTDSDQHRPMPILTAGEKRPERALMTPPPSQRPGQAAEERHS